MRCQKCGYTSFDYLADCKKCGTDLTALRDELGFLPFKPEISFLLDALAKAQDEVTTTEPHAAAPLADPPEIELPEIEFGDEFDFEGHLPTMVQHQDTVISPVGGPGGYDQAGLREEDATLELTDEDLDQFLQEQEDELGFGMLLKDQPPGENAALGSLETLTEPGGELQIEGEFILQLEDEEPGAPLSLDAGGGAAGVAAEGPEAPLTLPDLDLEPFDLNDTAPAETGVDALPVIEISEDELETLFLDLETVTEAHDRPDGDAGAVTQSSPGKIKTS